MFGSRLTPPASTLVHSSAAPNSALMGRMSENQITSRPLASAPQGTKYSQWQSVQKAAFPRRLPQAQADTEWSPAAQRHASSSEVPQMRQSVDWNSYLDDSNAKTEAAGMRESSETLFELQGNALQPFDSSDQHAVFRSDLTKAHMRSPMDAKLEPLSHGPSSKAGHMQPQQQPKQQQHQHQLPARHHALLDDMQASRPPGNQLQARQHAVLDDMQASRPAGNSSYGSSNRALSTAGPARAVASAIDLTKDDAEASASNAKGQQDMSYDILPYADKENAEHMGRKPPVRKSLFANASTSSGQEENRIGTLLQSSGIVQSHNTMNLSDSSQAVTKQDKQHEQPMQSAGSSEMDFSSVFDFL